MDYEIKHFTVPLQIDLSDQAIADFKVIYFKKYGRKIEWWKAEKLGVLLINVVYYGR